jgi:hypothetical protein
MKTLKTMIVLCAAGAALLATPAFAQRSYQPSQFDRQFSVGSQETGSQANQVERNTGEYANGTN